MSNPHSALRTPQSPCSGHRREFLWQMGAGFAGLALTSLLDQDGFFGKHGFAAEQAGKTTPSEALRPLPHLPGKAKRVIFLFMYGGPSSMDSWDYKPEL